MNGSYKPPLTTDASSPQQMAESSSDWHITETILNQPIYRISGVRSQLGWLWRLWSLLRGVGRLMRNFSLWGRICKGSQLIGFGSICRIRGGSVRGVITLLRKIVTICRSISRKLVSWGWRCQFYPPWAIGWKFSGTKPHARRSVTCCFGGGLTLTRRSTVRLADGRLHTWQNCPQQAYVDSLYMLTS